MSPSRLVAVIFPRRLLPLQDDELAQLTAVPFDGGQGLGQLASSLALQMPNHLDGHGTVAGTRLGTAVLDLLSVALAARLDRDDVLPRDTVQGALLSRIHAFIEQRLGDPDLGPGTVAAAHHISVRYLHKLFETQQTTVSDWIRRRRLERSRRDLLDPAYAARPVSAIASRWGFTSPAHFSRLFRGAYGVPPGVFRNGAAAPYRDGQVHP